MYIMIICTCIRHDSFDMALVKGLTFPVNDVILCNSSSNKKMQLKISLGTIKHGITDYAENVHTWCKNTIQIYIYSLIITHATAIKNA